MEISIRELDYLERSAVFPLYQKVFSKVSFERWKKRWQWQFLETPGSETLTYRMWVAEGEHGDILGFFESFPIRLKLGNNIKVINCPCDLMVGEKARGHGLGKKIVLRYIADSDFLVNAFGYSPAAKQLAPVACLN